MPFGSFNGDTTYSRVAWELLLDLGSAVGYAEEDETAGCVPALPVDERQDGRLGLDINSATFVKDRRGLIVRDGEGKRSLSLGGAAVKDRVIGQCDFDHRSLYVWQQN